MCFLGRFPYSWETVAYQEQGITSFKKRKLDVSQVLKYFGFCFVFNGAKATTRVEPPSSNVWMCCGSSERLENVFSHRTRRNIQGTRSMLKSAFKDFGAGKHATQRRWPKSDLF
jgi:hypothetical protein